MRIKYNILWVDDRKETFIRLGHDKHLIDYVSRLFFEPHLIMCENIEEAKVALGSQTFDVIFSDYNISDSKTEEQGNDFIEYVREQNVNTEILFYSAMEELPPIHVNRISFFSFAGKAGAYRELLSQMELLIDLTVEKLNDLTALRGLVMAETSELDRHMEEICLDYFVTHKSEKSDKLFGDIITGLETDYKNNLKRSENCDKKCLHKIRNKENFNDIITSLTFESSRKARTINAIIGTENVTLDYEFYSTYLKEIINIRNLLAHSYSYIKDNGTEVLVSKKDEQDIEFNKDDILKIRKDILKYENLFMNLKGRIK